jgi:hypothetical protein
MRASRGLYKFVVILLLGMQTALLAVEAERDSPCYDEVGQFAAGLENWKHWRFSLYTVNPPFVRLIAMAPIAALSNKYDPDGYPALRGIGKRPEYEIGAAISWSAGSAYFGLLSTCRIACLLFSLLGGWISYRWARELWGPNSGLLALALWCFSPTILGYGHLITADVGAAAMGVAALYCFRRWLSQSTLWRAVVAGVTLGLAELTKTTWLVLLPLYPVLWLMFRSYERRQPFRQDILEQLGNESRDWVNEGTPRRGRRHEWLCIVCMFVVAWWVLNLGYGFEGTFKPLRDYEFISAPLGGTVVEGGQPQPGNRFATSWLGLLPVPVPENYLCGIDYMHWQFSHKVWSYLDGEWKLGGWWYYYILCLLYKEPVGTWVLLLLAVGASALWYRKYCESFREELFLLLPCIVVFAFVSSQTGINLHIRYVLPTFPFAFIWIAKVGMCFERRHWFIGVPVLIALALTIGSSLSVFPHHLSYFNELAGGPRNGWKHLDDSNFDWGQDLLYVKCWYDDHPEARPFHLSYQLSLINPKIAGIDYVPVPIGQHSEEAVSTPGERLGPLPGWYCVSAKQIFQSQDKKFDYFRMLAPVDYIANTMPVYHISVDQANELRRKMGLPALCYVSGSEAPEGTSNGERW